MSMETFGAAKVVYSRILESEPEEITRKIIGYIYLHDHADKEMVRLAFGPDHLIYALVKRAKIDLQIDAKPKISPPRSPCLQFTPFSPPSPQPFSSPVSARFPIPHWEQQLVNEQQFAYSDLVPEDHRYQNSPQFTGLEDQLEPIYPVISNLPNDYYFVAEPPLSNVSIRGRRQSMSLPEFPLKVCHYFNKGFCKHGSNCRYFHGGPSFPKSYPNTFDEVANEDFVFSPGSLEKLELEIMEILQSRRGNPVSIASLPMIYYEKYGRTLQAEGYLTESQRHGKAGCNLTKLLARLKNSIRLIDSYRPHGQHSIILAEDAPIYMETRCESSHPGPIVSGSRQIYLTFPAESTFTEEDVSNYFNTFGPVQDVRIPCQQKRMFGFVTFLRADTVRIILSKGNPHHVCGARVLVKPYREKPKLIERKYTEKLETPTTYHSPHVHVDSELQARWGSSRFLRQQLIEEEEVALELDRLHLSKLQLAQKQPANQSYFGYLAEPKVSIDPYNFPSVERLNYLLEVLKAGSLSDDNPQHVAPNYSDQDNSEGLKLPDSPFASAITSGIPTAT